MYRKGSGTWEYMKEKHNNSIWHCFLSLCCCWLFSFISIYIYIYCLLTYANISVNVIRSRTDRPLAGSGIFFFILFDDLRWYFASIWQWGACGADDDDRWETNTQKRRATAEIPQRTVTAVAYVASCIRYSGSPRTRSDTTIFFLLRYSSISEPRSLSSSSYSTKHTHIRTHEPLATDHRLPVRSK